MNTSRLIALTLCAVAATATAKELPPLPPILYGDGVHDDSPAFEAIVHGKPFRCGPHYRADFMLRNFTASGSGPSFEVRSDVCPRKTDGEPHDK